RTADPPRGLAVAQCLYLASLSNPARQCPGPDGPRDWRGSGMRRPDRPQRPACLQYSGAGSPTTTFLRSPADSSCGVQRHATRAGACAAAPEPPHLWQTHQSVDVALSRRGGVCRGAHVATGQWRSHSSGAGAPRCALATGQTLDYQPRSGVRPKKKRRDRLIALARTQPTWALAWGDEVWWSRLAQPALHTWTFDAAPLRLPEIALPRPKRAPKALACYGLLVRHVPTQPEQMLLRFVERRPVSSETTAFLAWCSTRLAAQGLTAVLLIWDNASWHISR